MNPEEAPRPYGPAPEPDPGRGASQPAYPDPRSAVWLTVGAIFATLLAGAMFFELGALAAVGLGEVVAIGGIASLALRRVPEPIAERVGLRGVEPAAWPVLLCLVPAVLLVSELDNQVTRFSPDPSPSAVEAGEGEAPAEEAPAPLIDLEDPWTLAQAAVIYVGLAPVVEELFFRGLIQQGVVAHLGLARGLLLTALLSSLLHVPAALTLARFLVGALAAVALAGLLGVVRVATGSVMASMALAGAWAAVGIGSLALKDRWPIEGLNVPGTQLPTLIVVACTVVVGIGLQTVWQEARRRHAASLPVERHSTR